jgi:protein phosphatase
VGIGPTRGGRATNEDNFLVAQGSEARWRDGEQLTASVRTDDGRVLVAVADGMGGHEDGEIASYSAVQALVRWASEPEQEPLTPESARAWMLEAHAGLRARASRDGIVRMGTTLSMAWIADGTCIWSHVGDSRIYLLRGGRLEALTRDHTRGEFAARDRRPSPTHAWSLAQNFIYGSRGLGDDAKVRIDAGVDCGRFELQPSARLLVCSDGVHGALGPVEIEAHLGGMGSAQERAEALGWAAMQAGSEDNVTAIVVDLA